MAVTLDTETLTGVDVRRIILEQSFRAKVGHIGSALSIADLVASVVNAFPSVASEQTSRDRFVLSKGHASLAWYSALYLCGRMTKEHLETFCGDGSTLGVHPDPHTEGVEFGTGSLGMGVSFGVGSAVASKLRGEQTRTAVIMSDAECNEGIAWEAAAFAAHHELKNLVVLVDDNQQQALGSTANILNQQRLADRWESFGWHVVETDGHNVSELTSQILITHDYKPTVIVAQTTFGYGVPYMERQLAWHYLPMTREQYDLALSQLY